MQITEEVKADLKQIIADKIDFNIEFVRVSPDEGDDIFTLEIDFSLVGSNSLATFRKNLRVEMYEYLVDNSIISELPEQP